MKIRKRRYSGPLKSIRKKCLECCAGGVKEVKMCQSTDCPLWGLRMGSNPRRQGKGGNPGLKRKTPYSSRG